MAELEKFLNELPEKVQVKVARNAMAFGARIIRDEAKTIVPIKTGSLKQSIRVSTRRDRDGTISASIRAGGKTKTGDAFYAHMVEFGTQPHFIKPKGKALKIGGNFTGPVHHPGARPKPFMRPALDSKWQESVQAAAARMKEKINEVKK